MSNQSIPQLTELTSPVDADELVIVDKSDTTDGSTGTNKKITKANLVGDKIPKSIGTTRGDTIYWTADSTPARLAKGSGLQYLRMNTGATAPEWATLAAGGATFWTTMPTVTRVSATQFTVPDAGGTTWQYLLTKGVCLKWTHTTTHQAMIISSSYGGDVTTVNIIGDTLDAGFTDSSFKYAMNAVRTVNFAIAGTIATGTNLAGEFYAPYDMKIFGADVRVSTAGTTNATDFDINDDGTTMFTTKPSIASTATSDVDNTADDNIVAAEDSKITVDIDAVSTTAPIDAYLTIYFFPNNNQYLT